MQDQRIQLKNNKLKFISVNMLKLDVRNFSRTCSLTDPVMINKLNNLIILDKEAFSTEDRPANLC